MKNIYLDLDAAGRNQVWRYILTIFLIIIAAFAAQIIVLIPLMVIHGTVDISNYGPVSMLLATMAPFPAVMLTVFASVTWLHGRSPLTLITPEKKINWRKLFVSAAIWFVLSGLSDVVLYLLHPGNYTWSFDAGKFLPYFLLTLLLIPIQTSTEELVFRGYLAQWIGRYTRGIALPLIIPALIFMLLHGANPEVLAYGAWYTLPFYFGIGLLLGWITLKSGSLELALGVHMANNFYSSIMVTFPDSSLPSPAFFTVASYDALAGLICFVGMALIYLAIFYWRLPKWKVSLSGITAAAVLLLALAAPQPVSAESGYQVQDWNTQITVQPDGSLLIHEIVQYSGVSADTRYAARELSLVTADSIQIISVGLNGAELQTGSQPGQVDLENIGGAVQVTWNFDQTPGETFALDLTYLVNGALRQNASGDLLEWTVIPTDHEYNIAHAQVQLTSPDGIAPLNTPVLVGALNEVSETADGILFDLSTVPANQDLVLKATYPAGSLVQAAPQWQLAQRQRSQALLDALPFGGAALAAIVILTVAGLEWLRRKPAAQPVALDEGEALELSVAVGACLAEGARFTVDHWYAGLVATAQRGAVIFKERAIKGYFGGRDYELFPGPDFRPADPVEAGILAAALPEGNSKSKDNVLYQPVRVLNDRTAQAAELARAQLVKLGCIDLDRMQIRTRLGQVSGGLTIFGLVLAGIGTLFVSTGGEGLMVMAVLWIGVGFGAVIAGLLCGMYAGGWDVLTPKGRNLRAVWQAERLRIRNLIDSRQPLDAETMLAELPLTIAFGMGANWAKVYSDLNIPVSAAWVIAENGQPGSVLSLAAVITASAAMVPGSNVEHGRSFLNLDLFRKES
jgi:membrane protease YdiL (CAAX protease family)